MSKISSLPIASDLAGDEQVVMVKDGVTRRGAVAGLVGAAVAPHVEAAQLAADTALAASNYYGSAQYGSAAGAIAAGEAATALGHLFSTDDGDGNLIMRARTADGSVEVARMVTPFALASGSGAEMIGASRTEPGSVYQTARQRLNNLKLTPEDFRGAGDLNDNDAILAAVAAAREKTLLSGNQSFWAATSGSIRLRDKGVYTVTDVIDIVSKSGFGGMSSLRIFADDLGDCVIQIPDGQYFSECDERLNNLSIRNLCFVGGKGVFLQNDTGVNVNGWRIIERCYFDDYTEAAIASNAADDPYWRIQDCLFMSNADAPARGVVLGGLNDNTQIRGNSFLRNTHHIVLGPVNSGNIHIVGNDFISWSANKVDADIVLIANDQVGQYGNNAGMNSQISYNKFGNENLKPTAPRILVSTFDTSTGTGRQNYPISSTWVSGAANGANWIQKIEIGGNRFSVTGDYNAPIIRSYIDRLDSVIFEETNSFDGGQPTHLIEWMGNRTIDRVNANWKVKTTGMALSSNGFPPKIISNQQIGAIEDTLGYFGPSLWARGNPPSGSEQTILNATGNSQLNVFSGATKADIAGEDGGTAGGCEVTAASNTALALYCNVDATAVWGGQAWINIALKRGSSTPITRIRLELINFATNNILLQRDIALPIYWARHALNFEFDGGVSPTAWQLRFTPLDWAPGTRTKFCVATPLHIHTGATPLRTPIAASIANLSSAPTESDYNALLDILRANGLVKRP